MNVEQANLPLCLLVTSSMILDRRKMTAHQKVAHVALRGTSQSPDRS